MVETTAEIATHIETTREHLGANLDALEQKIKSATDWREYFQSSPLAMVGAAFAGGVVLAMTTGTRARRVTGSVPAIENRALPPRSLGPHTQEVVTMIDNVKGTLIGMAATRMKDVVSDMLPGFRDEFERRQRGGVRLTE